MQKDDLVYVGHMLDMARKAIGKIQGRSRADYDADEDLRLALTHIVQTLGEAARRASLPFQQAHLEIPWRKIVGMRHKVVHDYLEVDYDLVWDVVSAELPALVSQLEQLVPPDPSGA